MKYYFKLSLIIMLWIVVFCIYIPIQNTFGKTWHESFIIDLVFGLPLMFLGLFVHTLLKNILFSEEKELTRVNRLFWNTRHLGRWAYFILFSIGLIGIGLAFLIIKEFQKIAQVLSLFVILLGIWFIRRNWNE